MLNREQVGPDDIRTTFVTFCTSVSVCSVSELKPWINILCDRHIIRSVNLFNFVAVYEN